MRVLILGFLSLLFACASEEGVKIYNSEPTASITSHSDGAEFLEGVEYTFVGQVTDTNHSSGVLLAVWSTDTRELCPQSNPDASGETVCRASLDDADTKLKLQVTDPEGAAVLSAISINVVDTQAPTIEIISPVLNGRYYSDQLIHFSAVIQDTEDEAAELIYSWESNLDGELPLNSPPTSEGLLSGYINLSEGQHAIALRVEDTTGKSSIADLAITVGGENNNPACEILTPDPGSGYVVGQNINFTATVSDEDIDNNLLSIKWESDFDGEFNTTSANTAGELTVVYDGLSIGNHIVTLTVEDDVGATCSDTVAVAVGTPPTLTLASPLSGDVFTVGNSISFSGTVEDQEDVPSDITISWVSDIDGEFSTQGSDSSGTIAFGYGGLSAGQHNLSITATDSDGLTSLVAQSIRINTPPDAPEVILNPQNPYTADGIFAIATGSDPDGDTVTFGYEWFSNFGGSYTGSSLPSSETAVGEVWTLTVTPNDGTIDGVPTTATATIANTEPTLSNVYVTPNSTVYNDSVLTCVGTVSDADETLTPTYMWNVGTDIYTGSTLDLSPTAAMPNDTVTCTVSVEDSNGGSATQTASVSVSNRDPLLSGLALSESMVYVNSSVSCSGTIADDDGETPSYSVEWSTASGVLSTSDSITLNTSMVSVGDTLTCMMLVEDGFGGAVSDIVSTTILNTDPTIDSVTLTPLSPNKHETLVCSATATDIDGDTPTLSFAWSNLTTGLTYTSTATDATSAELDLSTVSAIAPEDEVECVVTATDTDGGSVTQVETVEILNSTPQFDSPAGISPNTAVVTNTQLTCSAVVTDPDDGSLTPTYEWFIGTTSMGTGATYTVFANDTDVGDTITCVATAVDSDGETVTSSAGIVVENTDPVASLVGIDNSAPFADDTITCSASASDVDAETLTINYEWVIGSNLVGSAASLTLTPSMANVGDNVVCTATVTDGQSGSDAISTTVIVQNTAPTISAVSISPSTATATDLLTCSATGADLNDGPLSPVYVWTNQTTSASLGTAATLQLDASIASPDDVISCAVTFTDNNSASISDSANLTTINTAPIFDDNAAITPSTGVYTGAELTCIASASDADDGIITPTYEWSVGTATIGSGETYTVSASDTDVGDSIVCTATATDSDSETAVSTSFVVVENTAPVLSGTAIDLSTIYNDDTVVCSSSVVDPDESLSISYEWSVSGIVIGSSASLDLGTTSAVPGDNLGCTVSVMDSQGGTDSETATIIISNRVPSAPIISITPSSPQAGQDDLLCQIDAPSVDDDGETVGYAYSWTVNGAATSYTTDTILASLTSGFETWVCTVVPSDNTGVGASGQGSVTIAEEGCSIDTADFPVSISNNGYGDITFDGNCNIWADGSTGHVAFYDVDSRVLQYVSLPGSYYTLGIAYHPEHDLIYASTSSSMFISIDPYTLSATEMFSLGVNVASLEVIPDSFSTTHAGQIIGGTSTSELYLIDPTTQQASTVASLAGIGSDVVFSDQGVLYGVSYQYLFEIDSNFQVSTLYSSFSGADGVTYDSNQQRLLIADSSDDQLYSYNISSGSVTGLGSYNFNNGWYSSGILYGTNGVVLLLLDNSKSLEAITP